MDILGHMEDMFITIETYPQHRIIGLYIYIEYNPLMINDGI